MTSNVSRRTALKLIGVGAGGLIIGVAAASMILPGGQGRITTTVTVTETKGVTVTPTQATTPPGAVQQQGITVWGQGPEPESHYRFDNIVTAGNRVSKIVSLAGGRAEIRIGGEYSTAAWSDYRTKLQNALSAGAAPDIFIEAHHAVAPLSEAGWILALDDFVKQYWDWGYNDFIDGLWSSVRYKGKIYAIPQDTEARPIYYRKDLLKKLGWSDTEIEEMPNRILKGDFTFQDMLETAAEAVSKGVVQPGYGIWHRPNAGPDWPIPYLAFGGTLYDEGKNVLVADMKIWYRVFEWFYQASMRQKKAIWDKLIGLDFNRDVHPTVVAGKVLFWWGGTWHKGQWIGSFGLKEEDFWKYYGFALYPPGSRGGNPVTLSQPLAYFIYSRSRNPELAFLLVTLASDTYLNSLHAVESAHLAIRYSQLSHPIYVKDRFLKETGYMVAYAKYQPNHPKWGTYSQLIFETIRGIEGGALDPDRALNTFSTSLQRQLGESVVIRE
jgi:inositol-phosphate transport system substrate-binding protein